MGSDRERAVQLLKEHVTRLPDPGDVGVALPAIAGVAAVEKYGLNSAMDRYGKSALMTMKLLILYLLRMPKWSDGWHSK